MEKHAEDARRKAMVIDIDMLVPKDHLLRKIEKVMDYDWLYERLTPLCTMTRSVVPAQTRSCLLKWFSSSIYSVFRPCARRGGSAM